MNRIGLTLGACLLTLAMATVPVANAQETTLAIAKPACTATYLLECFMGCDSGEELQVVALGYGSGRFRCGGGDAYCSTSLTFLACTGSDPVDVDDDTGICSASLGTQVQCTAGTSFLPSAA